MDDVVVDSDELLRRIQRARAWAAREEERWRDRSEKPQSDDVGGGTEAHVNAVAYSAVRQVLDEVIEPGSHDVF
ncbi:3-deoxy-D-manno-octulosonic acid transferase [Streptomyces cavernae]|uniref:3-deoxy-D-manno-octulosonic acid transferase n=1 Tax=Streptomyces cavernae TaxID=2259034 RepID=UPI000FEBDD06|nr:3-deoxy-D-manno-octulosonic acid transferase [Streptomyces cavernae]